MTITLFFTLLGLAAIDSINTSTIWLVILILLTARRPVATGWAYTAGAMSLFFIFAVFLFLGAGLLLLGHPEAHGLGGPRRPALARLGGELVHQRDCAGVGVGRCADLGCALDACQARGDECAKGEIGIAARVAGFQLDVG